MKLLFTSVGRRVELLQSFKLAAEKVNDYIEIYGADSDNTAPALLFCDHSLIVPKINSSEYIPMLKKICLQEKIDALIPTIDTDLLILAQNRDNFANTKVLVSKTDKIKISRNKKMSADYFSSLGLKTPSICDNYLTYDAGFPAFIKPKDGSSSISAYKVDNYESLKAFAGIVSDYIIQPYILGTEYTVDIFCDFDGNPIFITPRIRLAVRSGEVLKTQIVQDEKIIESMKILILNYRPRGQITVQLIRERLTGDDYYIEINPRFGGGAPLSIKAGADSAEMLLRLLKNEKIKYIEKAATDGAVFCRYDQSVRLK